MIVNNHHRLLYRTNSYPQHFFCAQEAHTTLCKEIWTPFLQDHIEKPFVEKVVINSQIKTLAG